MRAFRSFAVVVALWIGGRAILLVGTGNETLVSSPMEPARSDRQIARLEDVAIESARLSARSLSQSNHSRSFRRLSPERDLKSYIGNQPVEQARTTNDSTQIFRSEKAAVLSTDPSLLIPMDGPDARSTLVTQTGLLPNRRAKLSGYVFLRGSGRQRGLSGNAVLGGSQIALSANGPQIADVKGFAISPFARVTADSRKVAPQELTFGARAEKRANQFVYGASLERRAKIDAGGRDAFAAQVTIGTYARIDATPFTLSGSGQAGIVGLNRRDGFAESEVILAASEGNTFLRAKPGIGLWAAIQPRAARIDIGPTLDIPIIRSPIPVTIRTSWRFRVGGNALPGSGPALIVATGF